MSIRFPNHTDTQSDFRYENAKRSRPKISRHFWHFPRTKVEVFDAIRIALYVKSLSRRAIITEIVIITRINKSNRRTLTLATRFARFRTQSHPPLHEFRLRHARNFRCISNVSRYQLRVASLLYLRRRKKIPRKSLPIILHESMFVNWRK